MYTTMGFLFIIFLAPVYNGLALALAMEHLALAYFSWGPSRPDSRTLSWMSILLSFDSFAVGFHIPELPKDATPCCFRTVRTRTSNSKRTLECRVD